MNNTFEWCNKGISAQKENLQGVRFKEDLDGCYEDNFDEHGMFLCGDVRTLPKGQSEILQEQGIKALLQCNNLENGKFKGMVGFDDCYEANRNWTKEKKILEVLLFLSHILSLYLLKERHLDRLNLERIELNKMINKANAAKETKEKFLSIVSHYMITPLNGILGLIDMLFDKVNNPNNEIYFNEIKEFKALQEDLNLTLNELKDSSSFLLNLINDTLEVSKIENDSFSLSYKVLEGEKEILKFFRMINNIASLKNIKINFDYKKVEKGYFYLDNIRIFQIFFNILGNSIKFSKSGSVIDLTIDTLKIENNKIYKRFVIQDYGIGMSKEFIDKIFIPFEREENVKNKKSQGTGLGMAISKKIIDAMGGSIKIESELNKGTRTEIILPVKRANSAQAEQAKKEIDIIANYDFNGKRVLLCEDNYINAKVAKNYLNKKGLIVDIAENGKIGYEIFINSENDYYKFILMDI